MRFRQGKVEPSVSRDKLEAPRASPVRAGAIVLERRSDHFGDSASCYHVRLYSNQPFDLMNFVFREKNVGHVERCPRWPDARRLQVTGTEAQHRPEQIRAELLKAHCLGVNAFCAPSDDVLYRHLSWTYAPISHPVEYKEHQHPNKKQGSRKYEIKPRIHLHRKIWKETDDFAPPAQPSQQNCNKANGEDHDHRLDSAQTDIGKNDKEEKH